VVGSQMPAHTAGCLMGFAAPHFRLHEPRTSPGIGARCCQPAPAGPLRAADDLGVGAAHLGQGVEVMSAAVRLGRVGAEQ
jgi:hypothetical protein